MASGKFVLRLPIELHAGFQQEAKKRNISLNSLILEKLGQSSPKQKYIQLIEKVFEDTLIGIVQFGSTVRGEAKITSDIDLLLVLKSEATIDRSLYKVWDDQVASKCKEPFSPQFVHLPSNWNAISSLWLEVGLEGEIKLDRTREVRSTLSRIKSLVVDGKYKRRISHGHPYWVRE